MNVSYYFNSNNRHYLDAGITYKTQRGWRQQIWRQSESITNIKFVLTQKSRTLLKAFT